MFFLGRLLFHLGVALMVLSALVGLINSITLVTEGIICCPVSLSVLGVTTVVGGVFSLVGTGLTRISARIVEELRRDDSE